MIRNRSRFKILADSYSEYERRLDDYYRSHFYDCDKHECFVVCLFRVTLAFVHISALKAVPNFLDFSNARFFSCCAHEPCVLCKSYRAIYSLINGIVET